ncbi:hypothetical protein [Aeoliella mucimassa]|uniref:TNFR-Cys domain-containing protein n=1 Tax=Aeoliella mucimassa TaxID=2527972 RepID=A0A518ARX9_9BACT|nr:hypothetical protein [Aeoliella mucimassa]QDU57483.1 hypothetical protein Pan181_37000 [Aeoliella mucimassa]
MSGLRAFYATCASLVMILSVGCQAYVGGSCGSIVGCGSDCGCTAPATCAADCGCAAEPGCGCGDACGGACGRSYAFQRYQGNCDYKPFRLRACTGSACSDVGPGCGCEPGCVAEPACGCGPTCGDPCDPCDGSVPCERCGEGVVNFLGRLKHDLFGPACAGCDGELYWSEWHNDPPQCTDPCNRCGTYVGPSSYSGYSAGGCSECQGGCSQCQGGYAGEQYTSPNTRIGQLPSTDSPRLR